MAVKQALAAGAVLALGVSAAAFAAQGGSGAEPVVTHHMAAAGKGDVAAIMRDYADDAVMIVSGKVYRGKPAIEGVFKALLSDSARAPLVTNQKVYEGGIGYLLWTQKAPKGGEIHGSDTFVVRDGKIHAQTVAMATVPTAKP